MPQAPFVLAIASFGAKAAGAAALANFLAIASIGVGYVQQKKEVDKQRDAAEAQRDKALPERLLQQR